MSKQEWATFEFMDRAATVELMIAELLTDHPVGKHPALAAKLTALEEAAGQLYQAAGSHHHGYHITTPAESPAKPEPATVKQDLTVGVPVVDAVWVEGSFGDGLPFLTPHSTEKRARAVASNIRKASSGTARIVRLAPDADLAATVKRLEERVAKLEAATTGQPTSLYGQPIVHKYHNGPVPGMESPATTPAKVRVVTPIRPPMAPASWWDGWNAAMDGWRSALSAAGIDVVKEASK